MSRVLLDTHTLLWFVANDAALPESPRALIEKADEDGHRRVRLLADRTTQAFRAAALPPHHRDPFDRLLSAQAVVEGLAFVAREDFSVYGVATYE